MRCGAIAVYTCTITARSSATSGDLMLQEPVEGSQQDSQRPEDSEMARLLEAEGQNMPVLRRGEAVEGTIVHVDEEGLLVNIGAKSEGVIPYREMRSLPEDEARALKAGDSIVATLVRTDEAGQYMLSYDRAQAERGWRQLEKEKETDELITGKVIGHNRGGILVETRGVQAFVPLSQLSPEHRELASGEGDEQLQALDTLVGQEFQFKVIEVNRRRQRAILSERAASQDMRIEQRQALLAELQEGTVRKGRVTGVRDFGAFVDLGGADGLIHVSELAWEPVTHPSEIVQTGQELEVHVLKVDHETGRISLSLRRTQPDPWLAEVEAYQEGQIVEATVTRLAVFGAFARLEQSNIEGLIHISEMADHHINHPREVIKEGDTRQVKVLRIEPERRRLGLSLRQVEA